MRHISTVESFKASDGKLCHNVDELVQHEFKLVLQKRWMDADIGLAIAVTQCFDELHEVWHARERYIKGNSPPLDTPVSRTGDKDDDSIAF